MAVLRQAGVPLPALAAVVAWLAAVAWPVVAAWGEVVAGEDARFAIRNLRDLFVTSAAWSLAITLGAVVIGWAPGRLLGHALGAPGVQPGFLFFRGLRGFWGFRGFVPLAALAMAPLCLPAYVIFWSWWQMWPPGSALFEWAAGANDGDRIQMLRWATLLVGLVSWSWPIVALCVAGSVASVPAERRELLMLDGAGFPRRLRMHLRDDARALAIGAIIVALAAFNNTTCFDLAVIFTFGNELRALDAQGAPAAAVLGAGAPAMLVAVLGAAVIWMMLSRSTREAPSRVTAPDGAEWAGSSVIWIVSVALPLALCILSLSEWKRIGEFVALYREDLANTIAMALATGAAGALITVGLARSWHDERGWIRAAAHVQTIGWLIAAAAPATIVGVALEAAYNRPALAGAIYTNPVILVIAMLARYGFIAALLGRWVAASEPRSLQELRRLDGAFALAAYLRTTWPRLLAAGGAAMAVITALAMSEVAVTARLQPPGYQMLAKAVLDAIHYQRPYTVMSAVIVMLALALVAAFVTAGAWLALRRTTLSAVAALGCAIVIGTASGCEPDDPRVLRALDPVVTFGVAGLAPGQFNYPRGIAADDARGFIYVVDKSARVQRLGLDGKPQLEWRMPAWENGKPTGISVAPDGRVFVPDTHYFRVIAYDHEGRELMRFGRYGTGPGEFIYPTDVAFGADGRLYVSEYGGNDRVQVFSPEGEYLFAFGSAGSEPGQLSRPQGMEFSRDARELYIADSCNHRIVVVDPEGRVLRQFGRAGRGAGELMYPYGVTMLEDGTLLVCEFGNNRVQRFTPEGEPLGMFGGYGAGEGKLQYPWSVAAAGDTIVVLDSGNNRVHVVRSDKVTG